MSRRIQNTGDPIRVAIADDQALVLEGLRTLLSSMTEMRVDIVASSGQEILLATQQRTVDVAIVDIRMPVLSGFDVAAQLAGRTPPVPVILLTTFDEPHLLKQAVHAGAQGLLLKGISPSELQVAVQRVAHGEQVLMPIEMHTLREVRQLGLTADRTPLSLTDRERSVLRLAAAGHSNKEIALALGLVEGTIKNYMSELLLKLEARDRTQAVLKAIGARLL